MGLGELVRDMAAASWFPWALGGVAGLLTLLLVVERRRPRSVRARLRRAETKVAPRRRGSARPRAAAEPAGQDGRAQPEDVMETGVIMAYVQSVKVLLQGGTNDAGMDWARDLFRLAKTLHAHRVGSVQDLREFTGDTTRLLHGDVQVRSIRNANGVALRFVHDGVLLDEAPGPFRDEHARRFATRSKELQRELLAWLESVLALAPDETTTSPERPMVRPASQARDPVPETPREPSSTAHADYIDLEGLRSEPQPPSEPEVRVYEVEPERSPSRRRMFPFQRPSAARAERDPIYDTFGSPEDRTDHDEYGAHDDPGDEVATGTTATAPNPDATPTLEHLPPRMARAVEEIDELREELRHAPATATPRDVEKHVTASTMERTSLLDRLDLFVFRGFDVSTLPPELTASDEVRDALRWMERQQRQLAAHVENEYGLRLYTPEIGEAFEPTRHVAMDTQPTSDRRRDRTVASVVDHGYEVEGGTKPVQRSKVMIYVFEEASSTDERARADDGESPSSFAVGDDASLEVPVDYTYAGTTGFSITVQALWRVGRDLRAWLEVDGRRVPFASVEAGEPYGSETRVHLGGCDVPNDVREEEGLLVLEDAEGGRTARHPFEVIT